jgi:hypothetical protein
MRRAFVAIQVPVITARAADRNTRTQFCTVVIAPAAARGPRRADKRGRPPQGEPKAIHHQVRARNELSAPQGAAGARQRDAMGSGAFALRAMPLNCFCLISKLRSGGGKCLGAARERAGGAWRPDGPRAATAWTSPDVRLPKKIWWRSPATALGVALDDGSRIRHKNRFTVRCLVKVLKRARHRPAPPPSRRA